MAHTKSFLISFLAVTSLCLMSCGDFFEEDLTDKTVRVIAPHNGAELSTPQVSMAWQEMEGARQYHVMIVSPSFENARSYVCDTTLTGYTFNVELPNGDYQWSIRAENSEYASLTSYQSFNITVATDDEEE